MRKKLIIYHGFILFFSLMILTLFSLFTAFSVNKSGTEKELNGYLNISRSTLSEKLEKESQEDAIRECAENITSGDSKLRITIISSDGKVLFDSSVTEIEENHLNRPEIENLGKCYTRYSDTLKKDMMYIAGMDSSSHFYIRLALPYHEIQQQVNSTIAITIGIFVTVLIVSIFVDYYSVRASLKPLNNQIKRLSSIVSEEVLPSDNELESLSLEIDKTKDLIVEKIDTLQEEKDKLRYIIDTMDQGLFILDDKKNLILINQYCKSIFHYEEKENASLFDITIDPIFPSLFAQATKKENAQEEVKIGEKTYIVSSTKFEADWIKQAKFGICYTLSDITYEKDVQKAKRDFFANASHELKSPLTSIIGYAQMIKSGFVTDKKEVEEDFDRILFEAKRMNEIIIEMLDLSQLEAKETSQMENLSIEEVVKERKEHFSASLKKNNISFNLKGDDFSVIMSRLDLTSLIGNLFENAIRYNKEGGNITIHLDKEKKKFIISDTGIGIPKEDIDHIFERFYRVDKARSRKLGGTGLGLAIVKHICLNYNIKISVDSTLKEGSVFTLQF